MLRIFIRTSTSVILEFTPMQVFFEGVAKMYATAPEQYDTIQCDSSYSNHKLAAVLTKVTLNSVRICTKSLETDGVGQKSDGYAVQEDD